jgi:hypothetical protein
MTAFARNADVLLVLFLQLHQSRAVNIAYTSLHPKIETFDVQKHTNALCSSFLAEHDAQFVVRVLLTNLNEDQFEIHESALECNPGEVARI